MLTDIIITMGITRAKFAELLGISRAYLSGLESGKKTPSLELAVKMDRLTDGRLPAASWVNQLPVAIPNQETSHENPNAKTASDAA